MVADRIPRDIEGLAMIRSPRAADQVTWRDGAACSHHDPELFFPIGAAGPALDQVERAKQVCRQCPVREPCLRWALHRGVAFGIWGGATEDERRAMRRALVPPRSPR
jgi:WhiB family redox-sensing transcriptional regulator